MVTERKIIKKYKKRVKGRHITLSYALSHWHLFSIDDGKNTLLWEKQDQANQENIGTRWQVISLGITLKGGSQTHLFYRVTKTHRRKIRRKGRSTTAVKQTTRDFHWHQGLTRSKMMVWPGTAPIQRSSGSGFSNDPRVNPILQFAELKEKLCYAYSTDRSHGPLFFACEGAQRPIKVLPEAFYDFRLVQGEDGWLYLFSHEPESEEFLVHMSKDGHRWHKHLIDGKESGWQHDTSSIGGKVCALSFFFRNIFNKGLSFHCFEDGKTNGSAIDVVRARAFNTGWYPHFTFDGEGGLWLSYWRRIPEKERVWSYLPTLEALTQQSAQAPSLLESFYKPWSLQAGVGAWYTSWALWSLLPNEDETGGRSLETDSYRVKDALLTVASFEGRFFGTQLAMSYARSISDEIKAELTKFGEESTSLLTGQIEIPKPLPGHDVQVRYTMGSYEGSVTKSETSEGETQLRVDTLYHDAMILFLNKWRVFYGLGLTRYTMPMTLHGWYAAPGEHSEYAGSFFRDVEVTSARATFGYSTLDYASKYETGYHGFFLDLQFDGGLARLTFDEISLESQSMETTLSNFGGIPVTEDSALTIDLRAHATLGYLWMQRWAALAGFGLYLRPAYRVEGGLLGFPRAGGDNAKDEDESDVSLSPGLISLRHGPWLDIGLVW